MAYLLHVLLLCARLTAACERELPDPKGFQYPSDIHLATRETFPYPPVWTREERILHTSFLNNDIDTWSSLYTHSDHVAGRNKSLAEQTAKQWNDNGVTASLVEYEVLLSYPKEQGLVLKWGNGSRYETQTWEDVVQEDETTAFEGSLPAFHGYSGDGHVDGEYVFVGRGHKDDFAALIAANVTLEGKIALVKYGGPFRGLKVQNAENNGMIGVVMFSDPGDDSSQVAKGQAAYPKGPSRHPSSVQRGSVAFINQYPGDPTTPGRPSKPGVDRIEDPSNLPKIPSLPISYRDALPLLKALDGYGASASNMNRDGWGGGLNASYSSGPSGATLTLTNRMERSVKPIWNVIGIINGTEKDETVIIGNHRDAWIIGGAADPNSGSAILIEMTRAFGELMKTGWKPRRNIVFASWDAEEYALIGSTEWVEEYAPWLSDTALTYLNLDVAVSGPLPGAGATPEIRDLAMNVMQKVIYNNRTLRDAWEDLNQFRPEDNGFTNLGSGSDYTAFLQLGIGALDFSFFADRKTPVYHYHSNYDSYHWMKTQIDPDFSIHAAAGQFMTLLAYHLADDPVIPFDVTTYARNINYWVRDFVVSFDYDTIRAVAGEQLDAAAKDFQKAADAFAATTSQEGYLNDTARLREINKKMKQMQRLFIRESGLPGRSFYKNGLYAPNRDDGYKALTLPAAWEAIQDGKLELAKEWNMWLVDALGQASRLLVL